MRTTFKALLLAGLLLIGLITSLIAQTPDKYEFAILSYSPYSKNITISTDAPSYIVIELPEKGKLNDRNFTAVLTEVKKYQDEGWELFNTQATGMGLDIQISYNFPNYLFYMRRKK